VSSGAVTGWMGQVGQDHGHGGGGDRVQAVGQAEGAVAVQDAAQCAHERRPVAVLAHFGE